MRSNLPSPYSTGLLDYFDYNISVDLYKVATVITKGKKTKTQTLKQEGVKGFYAPKSSGTEFLNSMFSENVEYFILTKETISYKANRVLSNSVYYEIDDVVDYEDFHIIGLRKKGKK